METLKKKTLFWDTDILDPQKNDTFIIRRILDFGDVDDFQWAIGFYGREKMRGVILEGKPLNRKSFSFWCQYFNIDKSECLRKQSATRQSAFWGKSPELK